MLLYNILRGHDETPFNYYPKQTPASVLNDRHIGNLERYRLTEGLFWFSRQYRQEKEAFEGVFFLKKNGGILKRIARQRRNPRMRNSWAPSEG